MHFPHAVRYPNGFAGRVHCRGVLIHKDLLTDMPDKDITKKITQIPKDAKEKEMYVLIPKDKFYIARKCVYYNVYVTLCRRTSMFVKLEKRIASGFKYQICEVDGPRKAKDYPFSEADNNSLLVTRETAKAWLMNITQSFGHGVCLCIALINQDEWISVNVEIEQFRKV
jgi:hypothetical protein